MTWYPKQEYLHTKNSFTLCSNQICRLQIILSKLSKTESEKSNVIKHTNIACFVCVSVCYREQTWLRSRPAWRNSAAYDKWSGWLWKRATPARRDPVVLKTPARDANDAAWPAASARCSPCHTCRTTQAPPLPTQTTFPFGPCQTAHADTFTSSTHQISAPAHKMSVTRWCFIGSTHCIKNTKT